MNGVNSMTYGDSFARLQASTPAVARGLDGVTTLEKLLNWL
jgi:hypothetical protein